MREASSVCILVVARLKGNEMKSADFQAPLLFLCLKASSYIESKCGFNEPCSDVLLNDYRLSRRNVRRTRSVFLYDVTKYKNRGGEALEKHLQNVSRHIKEC